MVLLIKKYQLLLYYFLTMCLSFGIFNFIINIVDAKLTAYIAVSISAIMIFILEFTAPFYNQWKPNFQIFFNDTLYMITVQMVIPLSFALLIGNYIASEIHHIYHNSRTFWPTELHPIFQMILMLLISDFFRYWQHRLSHKIHFLRKFHFTHHQPKHLYWLNVARFHPIDKFIQILFDTLPFMILGVPNLVIGYYFVFYATNGFFQHCNIKGSLGIFGYLISGPEMHRLHHSPFSKISNHNYGNNILLYDLLFGTFLHPSKIAK